jgi:hypothetical protein
MFEVCPARRDEVVSPQPVKGKAVFEKVPVYRLLFIVVSPQPVK